MGPGKYVAPHLRSHHGDKSAEYAQVRLLNRLSETNVESITVEISTLFHSVAVLVLKFWLLIMWDPFDVSLELFLSYESYALLDLDDLGFCYSTAAGTRTTTTGPLTATVVFNTSVPNFLHALQNVLSELIYDFLIMLGKQLTEVDVSTVLTVLQCCGMNCEWMILYCAADKEVATEVKSR
ncbi:hypothetical protein Pfo_023806 [Paulownia fortunei]|nr:hypothetical protein Pfo_023806 [Paulownia fortunei]